eukprot:TRINITY_DN19097_c0_g1_i1.p1 TRINITY_DN19097_c0_g1~~TRINITY_DN19097_c0_g1_i1.p1  ORF type:complete len:466 (+),score=44.34 TRINITY_DN19097_c0_g1_i1:55-1452(+)
MSSASKRSSLRQQMPPVWCTGPDFSRIVTCWVTTSVADTFGLADSVDGIAADSELDGAFSACSRRADAASSWMRWVWISGGALATVVGQLLWPVNKRALTQLGGHALRPSLIPAAAFSAGLAVLAWLPLLRERRHLCEQASRTVDASRSAAKALRRLETCAVEAVVWIRCGELALRGFGASVPKASWSAPASHIEHSTLFGISSPRCVRLRCAASRALKSVDAVWATRAGGTGADVAESQSVPSTGEIRETLEQFRDMRHCSVLRTLWMNPHGMAADAALAWMSATEDFFGLLAACAGESADYLQDELWEEYYPAGDKCISSIAKLDDTLTKAFLLSSLVQDEHMVAECFPVPLCVRLCEMVAVARASLTEARQSGRESPQHSSTALSGAELLQGIVKKSAEEEVLEATGSPDAGHDSVTARGASGDYCATSSAEVAALAVERQRRCLEELRRSLAARQHHAPCH